MRKEPEGFRWSLTIVILIVNVLLFLLQHADGQRSEAKFLEYGALSLEGLSRGFYWQFLTFQFLHGGIVHLVLNSFVLWSFGRHLEEFLGKRAFLQLYLFSGFAGAVLQILMAIISPGGKPMVGASAGIAGLIAAFSLLSPHSTIYLMLVLPLRAKYLLPILIGIEVVCLAAGVRDGIAHAAHLGGLLFGIAYLRWLRGWDGLANLWNRLRPRRRARPIVKVRFPKTDSGSWETDSAGPRNVTDGEFISKEVDPILDKIRAHGIHSLTQRERDILEKARARMEKR